MRTRVRPPLQCLVAAAVALSFASHASAEHDACELLPQKDVEAVFGVSVEKGKRKAPSCAWDSKKPFGGLTIDVIEAAAARGLKGSHPTVEGLGDDAFFTMKMKPSAVLTVIRGDVALMISVMFPMGTPPGVESTEDAAKKLAKVALEKL